MSKKKQIILENIKLGKLVHGGQCLAIAPNGKKLFVWGGLPDEIIDVRVTKKKSSYMEGIIDVVKQSSPNRIEPIEPNSYLSTSPWQIMTFKAENDAKQTILEESFSREGVTDLNLRDFYAGDQEYGYRNKNEFGFWGSDEGLSLAHYVRGTAGKQMVQGSTLANESINAAAQAIRDELNRLDIWGGKLKTVLIRASQAGETVAALFMKEELDMSDFALPANLKGIDFYYSNPQSPASVPTKKLHSLGHITLTDTIGGKYIMYDVLSFFQVNIPVFEQALTEIKKHCLAGSRVVDMYSGVGTIGLAVSANVLIESDAANIAMAKQNIKGTNTKVVHATAETALDHIESDDTLIIDPPRAGLHQNVVEQLLHIQPRKIIYLSCNPSTQARDIKFLLEKYNITSAQGYNFFPRTPHIESLIILERQ